MEAPATIALHPAARRIFQSLSNSINPPGLPDACEALLGGCPLWRRPTRRIGSVGWSGHGSYRPMTDRGLRLTEALTVAVFAPRLDLPAGTRANAATISGRT